MAEDYTNVRLDSILERRADESELEHHKRLVYGKIVDRSLAEYDYAELSKYVYGEEFSGDTARRLMYGSRRTLDILERNNTLIATNGDTTLDEVEWKKAELQKERMKLQTEKVEYLRWLREDARDEMFMEKVLESIRENIGEQKPIQNIPVVHSDRAGVLCIADCHFGKEYKIYGVFDEIINEYSPEIFFARMNRLYNEVVDVVERESLNVLHIYNLGDSIEGFIRHQQLWNLRYGAVDSAILFGNYMGVWLRKLSEVVNIVYAQTDGNHDELRLLDGKKGQHLNESAGKIVRNCISLINEDNPNFSMISNKTGCIYDEVCGYSILGIHGEIKDATNAIKEYENIYNVSISYLVSGHMHNSNYKNCGARKGCIGIGSIVGIDDFSVQVRRAADATASTLIFEDGKGKVLEYTHVLN